MLIHPVNQSDHEQNTPKGHLRYEDNWKYPASLMKGEMNQHCFSTYQVYKHFCYMIIFYCFIMSDLKPFLYQLVKRTH